jgi:hypothetical protein
MVFRSSSVRAPELSAGGGGGVEDGSGGSALDGGGGGSGVGRHATTAEKPNRADRMRLLERTLRRGIALSVSISRVYRVSIGFYSRVVMTGVRHCGDAALPASRPEGSPRENELRWRENPAWDQSVTMRKRKKLERPLTVDRA